MRKDENGEIGGFLTLPSDSLELCWACTPVHNDGECCWCDYLRDLMGYYDTK
jgi:hypothetical protein